MRRRSSARIKELAEDASFQCVAYFKPVPLTVCPISSTRSVMKILALHSSSFEKKMTFQLQGRVISEDMISLHFTPVSPLPSQMEGNNQG